MVNRGVKTPMEVGQVLRFNNKMKMDIWPGDECNEIKGLDTTIFPPYITPETNLASFSGDICRYSYPIIILTIYCNNYNNNQIWYKLISTRT